MGSQDSFTRGVLYSKKSEENYDLIRVKPSLKLSNFIETFWLVSWDLRGKQAHVQQNIPDPCINMVFEAKQSRIVGAVTQRYSVELKDKGRIFGIKFHAGGFHNFSALPASSLTDKSVKIESIFGSESHSLIEKLASANDIDLMIKLSESFLLAGTQSVKESTNKVGEIISKIEQDQTITRVAQLSEVFGLSVRGLQRLFSHQVGVSPKWIIRKYRIREILTRLENGEHDWQALITHLDYFDQSHFIKDFQEIVGVTPSGYIAQLQSAKRL